MSGNTAVAFGVHLVTEECFTCGVLFAMPQAVKDARLKDHRTFYCPHGHGQHFVGKTAEQKLREQLAAKDRALKFENQARQRWENEATTAEYRRRAAKGQLTKVRNRIAKGVCPCCNRHFDNLQRHMETQHPDVVQEATQS